LFTTMRTTNLLLRLCSVPGLAACLLAVGTVVGAMPAAAEVWGYIDDSGHAHVASTQVDERYRLFFKGDVASTDDAIAKPAAPVPADTASAAAALPPSLQRLLNDNESSRYQGLIEHHASRESVDPALVKAIIAAESAFAPNAVSPKGALGLMQVMPQTAARYGVSSDKKRSAEQKLLDPAVNLQVGTRYLRDLLARFADNISLALAAYNAGENAVEKNKNRIPPYRETIEYVKRVQQLYAALRPEAVPAVSSQGASSSAPHGKRIVGSFLARPGAAQATQDEPLL